MTKYSDITISNAVIYYLQQNKKYKDGLLNGMKLDYTVFMLNIIANFEPNIKHNILDDNSLSHYTMSSYGPYNSNIRDTFDNIWSDDHSIKNALKQTFLFHDEKTQLFSVKDIKFNIEQIDKRVQKLIKKYVYQLWNIQNIDLSVNYFQRVPLPSTKALTSQLLIKDFLKFFASPANQFWLGFNQKDKKSHSDKLTKLEAKYIKQSSFIDIQKLIKLLQQNK